MKQVIYILLFVIIFSSCNKNENHSEPKHKNLLAFKTLFLAELGDEKYYEFEKGLKNKKVETKYLNNIVYVSYIDELNTCGQYSGNIEYIADDTIKLNVQLVSDEVCTSTSVKRITFLIDNPDGKKKTILK